MELHPEVPHSAELHPEQPPWEAAAEQPPAFALHIIWVMVPMGQ